MHSCPSCHQHNFSFSKRWRIALSLNSGTCPRCGTELMIASRLWRGLRLLTSPVLFFASYWALDHFGTLLALVLFAFWGVIETALKACFGRLERDTRNWDPRRLLHLLPAFLRRD